MRRDVHCFRPPHCRRSAKATGQLSLSAIYCITFPHATAAQYEANCLLATIKNDKTNGLEEKVKQSYLKETEYTCRASPEAKRSAIALGGLLKRIEHERANQFDPYVITPYELSYFLPAITTNALNREGYNAADKYSRNLEVIEAKLQFSFKIPFNQESRFIDGDALYLGFTMQAWRHIYSSDISKPFWQANYQPEVFSLVPLEWHPFGGNSRFALGDEHRSTGEQQRLSRSCYRGYGHFLFEKGLIYLFFEALGGGRESPKAYPGDPDGDDSHNIENYLGDFEVSTIFKWKQMECNFTGRNNMATHKGAAEFSIIFPLRGKLQGFASAFTGYGKVSSTIIPNKLDLALGFP